VPVALPERPRKLSSIPFERLYLWVALPVGLLFVFFNPPFGGVPDELQHYYKALAIAQGELGTAASAPREYVELRADLVTSRKEWTAGGNHWPRTDWGRLWRALTTRPGTEEVAFTHVVGYAYPIAYLPQALVLRLALLARAPPLLAFFCARLATYLCVVLLLHAALRLAPFGRLLFALVALLPETLQQSASLSYDALHLGGLLCFTAYLLALSQRPAPITRSEMGVAVGLSLAGTVLKPGYPLMALLVFLVPRARFRWRASYWGFTLGTVGVSLLALVLGRVWFSAIATYEAREPGPQIQYLLSNPIEFLGVLIRSLFLGFQVLWKGLIFLSGKNSESFPTIVYVFAGLAGAWLLRNQDEVVRLSAFQRSVLLGTALAQGAFVMLTLYLVNTKVGHDAVTGLQGRYFLVLVPPLVLSVYKSGFSLRSDWLRRNTELAWLVFSLTLLGCALFTIWCSYY
jgi:uncharacterized membrane protein